MAGDEFSLSRLNAEPVASTRDFTVLLPLPT